MAYKKDIAIHKIKSAFHNSCIRSLDHVVQQWNVGMAETEK